MNHFMNHLTAKYNLANFYVVLLKGKHVTPQL